MKPVFCCAACGFISTHGTEYTRIKGILFDKDCADEYERGVEPTRTWVAQKLESAAANVDA